MIRITNAQEVKYIFETITPREAKNLARATVHAMAGEARDDIRRLAPDDPKTRARDIVRSTKAKRNRPRGSYFSSRVVIGAFYWRFHEYGTVKMFARPFVARVIAKMRPNLKRIFLAKFSQKLEARLARAARTAR